MSGISLFQQFSTSFNSFKESILKFIRPAANSIFQCNSPKGIEYLTRLRVSFSHLTRLRVSFSHLCDRKFKHSFQDIIYPLCTCSLEAEATNHFILHCLYYENATLLSSIRSIKSSIFRGGPRTSATSKVELFVIIVNGFQPLTIITRSSTLDVAAVQDPPLILDQNVNNIVTTLLYGLDRLGNKHFKCHDGIINIF